MASKEGRKKKELTAGRVRSLKNAQGSMDVGHPADLAAAEYFTGKGGEKKR